MKFIVKFNGIGVWDYPILFEYQDIGINGLDLIRQETGVKELSLKRIKGDISKHSYCPEIYLDEDSARNSGHYSFHNFFKVCTEKGFLNQFCEKVVKVNQSEESGKIKKAWITWELNEQKVIEAWAEAGFPQYWGCEKPEKTSS